MIKIFNNELVSAYIDTYYRGEQILPTSMIKKLENDKDFMREIILITENPNYWDNASFDVKNDYELSTFLMKRFRGDDKFLKKILISQTGSCFTSNEYLSLAILYTKYATNKKDEFYLKLKSSLNCVILEHTEFIDKYKDRVYGVGFAGVLHDYRNYELITDYFAISLLKYVLAEQNMDLIHLLHKYFKNTEDLEEYGINRFIINFIGMYDANLEYYLSVKPELLNEEFNFTNIKKNFNKFRKEEYIKLINSIEDYINLLYYEPNCTNIEFFYLIGLELNLPIKEYYDLDGDLNSVMSFEDLLEHLSIIDKSAFDFYTFRAYMKIKTVVKSVLIKKEKLDYSLYLDNSSESKEGKIIKLNM